MSMITVMATFEWRADDWEFVRTLLEELRDVATVRDCSRAPASESMELHRIELRVAPASAEACLGLLAGAAEAGASLMLLLEPRTE